VQILRVTDLSSGFRVTETNAQMLYERCVADSSTDPDYVYRAKCRDISEFGTQWEFSRSFRRNVNIAIRPPDRIAKEAWFYLAETEMLPELSKRFLFPCSPHSPLLSSFGSYIVPRLLWGTRREQSPYVRVASRLSRKDYVLLFDGYCDFEKSGPSIGGPTGVSGTIVISINLPRFDYLSEYLKDYL
jgi:hypothetical protein